MNRTRHMATNSPAGISRPSGVGVYAFVFSYGFTYSMGAGGTVV